MTLLTFHPPIIAHRGASHDAPENTLAAIASAVRFPVAWVEFDVMLAACGTPIVFHDDTLNRTTNGVGKTVEYPYSYLQTLDAGSWFSTAFSGERIPTLKQALVLLNKLGLSANIEIKAMPGREQETAHAVLQEVRAFFPEPSPSILFSSFSVPMLMALRQASPMSHIGLLLEAWTPDWESVGVALGCVAIHTDERIMTAAAIERIKKRQWSTLCYTVDSPQRALELFALGVDAVFSNVPDRILKAIGS